MSLEKLKLSKRLTATMTELGYLAPKEIQSRCISRILGGQDVIAIAPEGAGKTTTYVLSTLTKLKFTDDEAPKFLILAPNEERIDEIVEKFYQLSKNKQLRIIGLRAGGSMEDEIEELVEGKDIVVATPNRARAIYLKLALNLNRIQALIIDDAEEIIKQGMQTAVRELAESCGKVQHLVFSTVEHQKLYDMIDDHLNENYAVVEVEELENETVDTLDLLLYHVPNFTTKINLLNLLLEDKEVFQKVVVFVNSKLTAQKLAKSLFHQNEEEIAILNPLFYDDFGFDSVADFKASDASRALIIARENSPEVDLADIPFIFQFELPNEKEQFLQYLVKDNSNAETVVLTFSTDLELPMVRKIEQVIGKRMDILDLPEDLVIYNPSADNKKRKTNSIAENDESRGGAFHQKKESNAKNYNYGGGEKAKMKMKKK
ncbi:DEAD/DEAH box helicase [Sphingobacterium thalpophilum]|uniref:ATP-dependent RNA helicase rhlE n=1 Tax=Sphingobacterium thalpophilum TaxID=259 RepID=A0A4U9W2T8_9SPHI|nr:DEAD/DEAH box helicase [Sphingobacterium thalpophilum]VTR52981.1 ATP-dependent RNA helicase rhlE [Sphingobacterium thalpophilum]